MHDTEIINRLNREAFLDAAEKARKDGKHVVVSYDGLHTTGYETFTQEVDAFTRMSALQADASPSHRFVMLLPSGIDIEAERPVQLLDGEAPTENQPELTAEEEGQLIEAANKRDRALTSLQAAAFEFAFSQQACTDLAEDLRKRMADRLRDAQQPLPFND